MPVGPYRTIGLPTARAVCAFFLTCSGTKTSPRARFRWATVCLTAKGVTADRSKASLISVPLAGTSVSILWVSTRYFSASGSSVLSMNVFAGPSAFRMKPLYFSASSRSYCLNRDALSLIDSSVSRGDYKHTAGDQPMSGGLGNRTGTVLDRIEAKSVPRSPAPSTQG